MKPVEWKTGETKLLTSLSTEKVMVDGEVKRKIKRHGVKTKFDYPVISADTMEDLYASLASVLAANKVGFTSVKQLVDHLNHGLYRSIAVGLNRGIDASLSPAQREAAKMYVKLVHIGGGIDRAFAIDAMTRQGISNAEAVFDSMLEGEQSKGNSDSDSDESDNTDD